MISKGKYTIFSLIFAVFFIFGSMEVTDRILQARETQLLTERGRAEMESPVRTWENYHEDTMAEGIADERYVLNTEQIEDAVTCWNNRDRSILHDPVAGQISMEEAIKAGEKWLIEMGTGEEKDVEACAINAELGVGVQTQDAGEQLEAYYSFWTVTYSNQSMSAVLYLNAVTGKVWGAELTLYEKLAEKKSDDSLRLFAELAGLQASDDDSAIVDFGETRTEIAIKESRLYAQEHSYSMSVGFENSYEHTVYQLLIKSIPPQQSSMC